MPYCRAKQAALFIIVTSLRWHQSSSCFIAHPYANNGVNRHKNTLQSTRSSDGTSTKQMKKRKNAIKASSKINGKRMRKSEIDDIVRGCGLQPVVPDQVRKSQAQDRNQSSFLNNNVVRPSISLQQQLEYARNGHTVLRKFIPNQTIQQLNSEIVPYAKSQALAAWKQKVEVQLADSSDTYYRQNSQSIANSLESVEACQDMLESLGLVNGDLPFLQFFNTWRATGSNTPTVRQLCLSPYLAQTASILMDSPTVRIYQDSLFHKRAGDGPTPWHSDARMAPFDTSKMITFWIPLQKVLSPENGGTGLMFVNHSHSDFALPYWNGVDGEEYERLEERYGSGSITHHMPMKVGDVTVHSGWTLHSAGGAELMEEGDDRYAFAITYVDGNAEVRSDALLESNEGELESKGDKEDVWSYRTWVKEVQARTRFQHVSVPIVWPIASDD